jgi:hypothetical protein
MPPWRAGTPRRGRKKAPVPRSPAGSWRCRCSRPSSPSTTSTCRSRPRWCTSEPVGKELIEALSLQAGTRVTAIPAARAAPPLAGDGAEECRPAAGPAAGRRRLAAGAHPCAGRGARTGARRPGQLPHRMLRHLAHRGRIDAGLVCGVPAPQDAEQRIPPLQHRRHHARRRLRRHAPGAVAALRKLAAGGRDRRVAAEAAQHAPPKRPRACPTWCWSTAARGRCRWRARCSSELGLDAVADRRRRKGRGPQGRPGRTGVRRRPRQGLPGQGLGRADAGRADSRRGAPLRHHRHARQARQGAGGRQQARRHSGHRPEAARQPAAALRRHPRRGGGERGGHRVGRRHRTDLAEEIYKALHCGFETPGRRNEQETTGGINGRPAHDTIKRCSGPSRPS